MVVGFVMGFWGVVATLFFIRSWRHAYYQKLEHIGRKLYVFWATMEPSLLLKRKRCGGRGGGGGGGGGGGVNIGLSEATQTLTRNASELFSRSLPFDEEAEYENEELFRPRSLAGDSLASELLAAEAKTNEAPIIQTKCLKFLIDASSFSINALFGEVVGEYSESGPMF
ncbi:hypothetical protein V6N12_023940 [Hibiscus sabdariffa]|uniref:Uncharacterized protein n=1 Tax=Hibiscus sabdariffa TaxID=183260 RepID=A0ABR2G033_9ROSI